MARGGLSVSSRSRNCSRLGRSPSTSMKTPCVEFSYPAAQAQLRGQAVGKRAEADALDGAVQDDPGALSSRCVLQRKSRCLPGVRRFHAAHAFPPGCTKRVGASADTGKSPCLCIWHAIMIRSKAMMFASSLRHGSRGCKSTPGRFGVHPSGCLWPNNTLKGGHQTRLHVSRFTFHVSPACRTQIAACAFAVSSAVPRHTCPPGSSPAVRDSRSARGTSPPAC